ncbi:MAG: hypothetical protein ACK5U8_01950 [Deltaproteobacteria bacterium]
MAHAIQRAIPDQVIEDGALRCVLYEIDLGALTRETAPLLVSHTFGRIGSAYPACPDHAHYVNFYVGSGIDDDVRAVLFPEVLSAAHSCSVQDAPAKPLTRRHGVLVPLRPEALADFVTWSPVAMEVFEIGPVDRPVEMHGFTVSMENGAQLEAHAAARGVRLVWLTPHR